MHVCPTIGALGGIRTSLQQTVGTSHNPLIRSHRTGGLKFVLGVLLSTESNIRRKISPTSLLNPLLNSQSAPNLHHFKMNAVYHYYIL